MKNNERMPLHMECTMLFQSQPDKEITIDEVALNLGKTITDLHPIIEQLVEQGILKMTGDEISPLYRYDEPAVITKFNKAGS